MNRSLLVCGATLGGLGAAVAALETKRDVVVVERTSLVGREFIEAFNPGKGWEEPATALGRSLRDDWVSRGLTEKQGLIHLPALHAVLCLLIKQRGLKLRFLTEIVEVAERDGGCEVLLHDAAGPSRVRVDELLDTSSERLTTPGRLFAPERKRLNAYLHHPDISSADLPAPIDETMAVSRGRFPSEAILKLTVDPGDDWPQARERLYRYWQARPAEWSSWTIAAVAGTFETSVPMGPQSLGDRWSWIPSEALSNPLAAIDNGYEEYRKAVDIRDAATTNG